MKSILFLVLDINAQNTQSHLKDEWKAGCRKRATINLKFLFATLCLLVASFANTQDFLLKKKVLSIDDGLLSRHTATIYHSPEGFTWFGTSSGLNRYDGQLLASFTHESGHLLENHVGQISEDLSGNLWLLHLIIPNNRISEISVFNPITNQSKTINSFLSNSVPFEFSEIKGLSKSNDKSHILIYTKSDEIFLIVGDSIVEKPLIISDENVAQINSYSDGFWVQFETYHAHYSYSGEVRASISKKHYQSIMGIDLDGALIHLQSTIEGDYYPPAIVYRNGKVISHIAKDELSRLRVLSVDIINERIWSTQLISNNIIVHDYAGRKIFEQPQIGERLSWYHPILMDKEGILWAPHNGEIFQYNLAENKFKTYLTEGLIYGPNGYGTRGMYLTDSLLFTNGLGMTQRIDLRSNKKESIKASTGYYFPVNSPVQIPLEETRRLSLAPDKNGNLWFGDEGARITRYNPQKGVHTDFRYSEDSHPIPYQHWSIYIDNNQKLWAGHNSGLSYLDQTDSLMHRFKNFGEYSLLNESTIYHFLERGDTLWLATTSGIYLLDKIKGEVIDRYHSKGAPERVIPSNIIAHINEFEKDILWLSTKGGGIILLDVSNNTFKQYTTKDGLSHNTTYAAYQDSYGAIWVSSSAGLMQIDNSNFNINTYYASNGLPQDEFNTISHHQSISGKIAFGGLNGVTIVDPEKFNSESSLLKIYINTFQRLSAEDGSYINDYENFSIQKGIQIYPGYLGFTLSYGIFDYSSDEIKYAYKIDGIDQEWTYSDNPEIRVRSLPYGKYNLFLKGKGTANFRSELVTIPITFHKPFYLKWWFFISLIILSLLLIISLIKYREKQSQIEQKKLQKLVDKKTIELNIEKNEVIKQLAEKEILVQEVHHRVKNNLTFLKSLLFLQSKASNDKAVKLILDECQARIQSMALVHQNLYDVDSTSQIDFKFFLKELFVELESMFDQRGVQFDVNTHNIMLDMKLSVILGLIVNEMITNSFKYAFGDGMQGKVTITFIDIGPVYELSYADNGRGLPEGFDIKTSSGFGFKLINILLDQIDANFTYVRENKNTFKISIPK